MNCKLKLDTFHPVPVSEEDSSVSAIVVVLSMKLLELLNAADITSRNLGEPLYATDIGSFHALTGTAERNSTNYLQATLISDGILSVVKPPRTALCNRSELFHACDH